MMKIHLLTEEVPGDLKKAVRILMSAKDFELEALLKIPLSSIKRTAEKCLSLATEVDKNFQYIMDMTGELLVASTFVQGKYKERIEETKLAQKMADTKKDSAEEHKRTATEIYEQIKKAIDKTEKLYEDSMKSFPSGWNMLAKKTAESISKSCTALFDAYTFKYAFPGKVINTVVGGIEKTLKLNKSSSSNAADSQSGTVPDKAMLDAYSLAPQLQNTTMLLATICHSKATSETSMSDNTGKIEHCKQQFDILLQHTQKIPKNSVVDRIGSLCKNGIEICVELKESTKLFQSDETSRSAIAKKLSNLHEDVMIITTESMHFMNTTPTYTSAPFQASIPSNFETDMSVVQLEILNNRYKVEQSSAQLELLRDRRDKAFDRVMESNQKLAETIAEIKELKIQEVSFEQILDTLQKGIGALGLLREQWAHLVHFFQLMSSLVEHCLNESLQKFLEYANTSQRFCLMQYPITDIQKDLMYIEVFQASKISYVVNKIAALYVEVSGRHLTSTMAGLGGLMGLDPAKNADKIERERQNLQQQCEEAQRDIKELVVRHKKEYDMQVDSRIQKIQNLLGKALPQADSSDEVFKRIKKAVMQGAQNAGIAEANPDDFS